MSLLLGVGTGWIPDIPRKDDPTAQDPEVAALLRKASFLTNVALPPRTSLRPSFPPVYDQGQINSCSANAASAVVAYYDRVVCGETFEDASRVPSRLFIYWQSRILSGLTGDNGAFLRKTMESMTLFGTLHEQYWPYDPRLLNVAPSAFCYSYAANYRATRSVRHDPIAAKPEDVIGSVKDFLLNGFPSVFGFHLFGSIASSATTGEIPMPVPNDPYLGGHAVVVVSYDDEREITSVNPLTGEKKVATGAFEIRNSWGPTWGDQGYGWLPYDYVLAGLTSDWWSLLKAEYLDDDAFGATAVQSQPARAEAKPADGQEGASQTPEPTFGTATPESAQTASLSPSREIPQKADLTQEQNPS